MLKRVDKQPKCSSAELEAAQTQAPLNEKKNFTEVHKSDTQDTSSRSLHE